jgi:hypothetical protein
VFEALQPAARVTGVHSRRVHYLFRDPAAAAQEVRRPCLVQNCIPSVRAHALMCLAAAAAAAAAAPAVGARGARLQVRPACGAVRRRARHAHALPPLSTRRADCVPPEVGAGFSTGYSYVAPVVRARAGRHTRAHALRRQAWWADAARVLLLWQVVMETYLAWLERCACVRERARGLHAHALRAVLAPARRCDLARRPLAVCHRHSLVAALGGTLQRRELSSLAEASASGGAPVALVVNCAALGAARLCGDAAMTPVRGVLVLVRCPGVRDVYSDESWAGPQLTYIVPKGGDVVACAGCAEPGATSCDVSAAEAAAVVERCAVLLPALRGAPVLSTWAGLRPVRAAAAGGVRLEAEASSAGAPAVVHNYGCVARSFRVHAAGAPSAD